MATKEDQIDPKEKNKNDPDRYYQEEKLKMSLSKALMTKKIKRLDNAKSDFTLGST